MSESQDVKSMRHDANILQAMHPPGRHVQPAQVKGQSEDEGRGQLPAANLGAIDPDPTRAARSNRFGGMVREERHVVRQCLSS